LWPNAAHAPSDQRRGGANLPGSPMIAGEGSAPDPTTTFMIPVRRWSDGTPAPGYRAL
jgi:hypothetical protein